MTVRVVELERARLAEARGVLARAGDARAAVVAEEKLFGPAPPPHEGTAFGALVEDRLVGVAVVSGRWLRVLAVEPASRRRGVGGALLEAAARRARAGGATRLRTADQPGNYLTPGIDARDDETLGWLRRRGFAVVAEHEDLRVPLVDNPRVTAARADAAAAACVARGVAIRRAASADKAPLVALAADAFSPAWAHELALALAHDPPGVHVALAGGEPVAFAAHDGNNRGLGAFGPAGTVPAWRGRGLGESLLLACLVDVAAAGHREAVIAWIGPRAFYERTVGALPHRRYLVLAKELS